VNLSSTHSMARRFGAALVALVVTVPVSLLGLGTAVTAAPVLVPDAVVEAADRTGSGAALGTDQAGDTKGPFGPVGERSSDVPDVPGQPVVEAPVESSGLVSAAQAVGDSAKKLRAAVADDGAARVIITMAMPLVVEAQLSASEVRRQRAAIRDRLGTLDRTLGGTDSEVVTEYTVVPGAVAEVDAAGLEALLADNRVAAVTLDREAPLALDVSTGVIDSDLLNTAGVLGNNFEGSGGGAYEVAILDSGVDNQHEAFTGRIVAQACFSATSWCPNGATSQIGGAAGDNCTYSTQCDHGTHVGGIAAGQMYTGGHEGVARGARIVALQIGHRSTSCEAGEPNPCWRYFFSDLDLALQHTLNLRNGGRNIAALNMSLGGPLHTTEAACGAAFPNTQNLAANLQTAGVAVVGAAGNDGSGTSVSYPGCLPSSFTVAASDDSDNPAGFSNNNAITDWWAPGVSIDAPVTTGTTAHGNKSGTSMATPHVVGAMALLRECVDGNGVPQTVTAAAADLSATGTTITHDGVSRPRVNVLDAATRNVNNNDFAFPEVLPASPGAGGFNDFDFTVCSDAEPGEPGPFSVDNGVWYSWTPASTGTATISTDDGGGNVTTFDTTLSVYTGDTLTGLTVHAFDDDAGVGTRSSVVAPVQGGTTYRIKVDGFGAANGLFNLHLENGPAPTCSGAAATIVRGVSDDVVNGTAGHDVIVTGAGADTVAGLGGNDQICAGPDNDTATYASSANGVVADLTSGTASGQGDDTLVEVENLVGTAQQDRLVGNTVANELFGGGGGDRVNGLAGDDDVFGGSGDDIVLGREDNDSINGGPGKDTAVFEHSSAAVVVNLAAGTASGEGTDSVTAIEDVIGSNFGDRVTGSPAANQLYGGGAPDVLRGSSGPDRLFGERGNDVLFGQDGNDRLSGGTQQDDCNGGPGTDTGSSCEVRSGIP